MITNWRLAAIAAIGTIVGLSGIHAPVESAELIMLERTGCVWCKRWDTEIAAIYPKTWEGRAAPLRRVDIANPWPDDLREIAKDRITPTFILINNGTEVARLRGYPGENFFWPLLDEMIGKLP